MKGLEFRKLNANEIECRVGSVGKNNNGFSLLLYKDARVDMKLLDEVVGAYNWKNSYVEHKGVLHCIVSIWDEDKQQWIDKQDCGVESNTEAQKGEASDAFKRACFRLGIGRELYTAPFIWISDAKMKYDKFDVTHIAYNDKGIISELRIVNTKTRETVYSFGANVPKQQSAPRQADSQTPPPQDPLMQAAIDDALAAIQAAGKRAELTKLYNELVELQHIKAFVNALNKRFNELPQ